VSYRKIAVLIRRRDGGREQAIMSDLLALGFWPWLLAAAHAFAASVYFVPRLIHGRGGSGTSQLYYAWSIGGAGVVAMLAGLIEASNSGLLAQRETADIVMLAIWLAVIGAIIGFVPTSAAFKLPQGGSTDGNRR
jgi:hypothetical protein